MSNALDTRCFQYLKNSKLESHYKLKTHYYKEIDLTIFGFVQIQYPVFMI